LLKTHPESAWTPDGIDGKLPLRLSIENGWPCYDIIIGICRRHYKCDLSSSSMNMGKVESKNISTGIKANSTAATSVQFFKYKEKHIHTKSILHTILSGSYHNKIGIYGARSIVKYVIKKYPDAAKMMNLEGRLPLHVAIEHGWPCHDLLVNAAPPALEAMDTKTGFYPFQIAALSTSLFCHDGDNDMEKESIEQREYSDVDGCSNFVSKNCGNFLELNVLYELIREGPMVMSQALETTKKGTVRSAGPALEQSSPVVATLAIGDESSIGKKEGLLLSSCRKRKLR